MSDYVMDAINEAIQDGLNPKGMATHSGEVSVGISHLQYVVKYIAKLEAYLAEANGRAQGLYNQAQANHIRAINAEAEVIELKKMLPRSMVGLSDEGGQ